MKKNTFEKIDKELDCLDEAIIQFEDDIESLFKESDKIFEEYEEEMKKFN